MELERPLVCHASVLSPQKPFGSIPSILFITPFIALAADPFTIRSIIGSYGVDDKFTSNSLAPDLFALTGNIEAGCTTREDPMVMNRSQFWE